MAQSMTGYGRASVSDDGRTLTVELKSVNHRFLDPGIRLPRALLFLEDDIRRMLQETLSRGHVDVFVNYENTRPDSREIVLDETLCQSYRAAYARISQQMNVRDDCTASLLARMPDVLTVAEKEEDQDAVRALCRSAMLEAAHALIQMRRAEGARLARDLFDRSQTLRALREEVSVYAPRAVAEYKEKLSARVAELMDGASPDPERLAAEVALYADRSDIQEELVRLASHLEQFDEMLREDAPVGRKLDFLVQELNREVNTIGSKSAMVELQTLVVRMKSEIEKIREQVQNIE